ncbi:MAG: restriction endonuclease [Candidatus Levybacteria bacterium]|nr:restriction endonuclease [Candidatus Levybacteria bacterium]
MNTTSFKHLTSIEFEEFCFDLLQKLGYFNVDWRKGTGLNTSPSDRGRDIVFQEERIDIDESKYFEKWFTDCKHHTKGVPPEALRNLLTWAEAERPDGVIFIVSNFLSNPAKDYIETYKKTNNPPFKIKVWERPMLEKLSRKKISLLRKYDLISGPIRSIKIILEAEEEYFDKIWYDRHQLMKTGGHLGKNTPKDIVEGALSAAKKVEKKYGKKNLGPYTDFEWGMINGKLSTLRWVLGDEWDMLDT